MVQLINQFFIDNDMFATVKELSKISDIDYYRLCKLAKMDEEELLGSLKLIEFLTLSSLNNSFGDYFLKRDIDENHSDSVSYDEMNHNKYEFYTPSPKIKRDTIEERLSRIEDHLGL
ncbi:hypothetical protein AB2B38_009610 [Balneola sp. MJW-20]|uniref:hypothetical protein n=1 Tax=Gracilimonas aurantiaca TaxID=3234185 RepID=UPI00390BB5A1